MKVTFGWQRAIAKSLLEPPIIKHTQICICNNVEPTLSICKSLGLKCSKQRSQNGIQLHKETEEVIIFEQQGIVGGDSDIAPNEPTDI